MRKHTIYGHAERLLDSAAAIARLAAPSADEVFAVAEDCRLALDDALSTADAEAAFAALAGHLEQLDDWLVEVAQEAGLSTGIVSAGKSAIQALEARGAASDVHDLHERAGAALEAAEAFVVSAAYCPGLWSFDRWLGKRWCEKVSDAETEAYQTAARLGSVRLMPHHRQVLRDGLASVSAAGGVVRRLEVSISKAVAEDGRRDPERAAGRGRAA